MRHEAEFRLILAGMRHLDRMEAFDGATPRLALRRGKDSQRLLGPPTEDREPLFIGSRAIAGVIDGNATRATRYAGREAYGVSARLKGLTHGDNWPQVPVFTAEGEVMQPEKAAEHGAVVAVEGHDPAARGVSLEWGVFLPVADAARLSADVPALRIMLHGYFFVDSGRQYIEGFASDLAVPGTGTTRTIYQAWNETLRDDLVLPLLPGVLHDALQQQMLTSVKLAEITRALQLSPFGRQHRAAIAARDVLARRVMPAARGAGGVTTWELLSTETGLRPLPAPDERGDVAIAELFPELCGWAERRGVALIAGPEAALTQAEAAWEPVEVADLLAGLAPDVFLQGGRAAVLATFLDIAVGGDSARQQAAAKPLLAALRTGAHGDAGARPGGVDRFGSRVSAGGGCNRPSRVGRRARCAGRPRLGVRRAPVPPAGMARRRGSAPVTFRRRGGAAAHRPATVAARRTDRRCRGCGRRGAGQATRPRSERGGPRSRLRRATGASRQRRKRRGSPCDLARSCQRVAGGPAIPRQPARA